MLIFYPNDVPVSSKFFNRFLLALEKDISPQPARGSQKRTTDYYYEHWNGFSKAHEQNHDLTYEEWRKQQNED